MQHNVRRGRNKCMQQNRYRGERSKVGKYGTLSVQDMLIRTHQHLGRRYEAGWFLGGTNIWLDCAELHQVVFDLR